ncbi:Carboxylesterase family-domain-containing protein [Dissophora ornata]|nr:hypothetical protein BGZ58_000006 [Dissophora ornata]KAI8604304.1 Carboxylesterase family-domain-containing protein [Dissophora ornata]
MVTFKTIVVTVTLAAGVTATANLNYTKLASNFQTTQINAAATLDANAPSAKDLAGVHLLLENDIDSETPKYPVILLSEPRTFQDAQDVCMKLGENLVAPTFGNLIQLLNDTPVAQTELEGVGRVWVSNMGKNATCMALDRNSGQSLQLSCIAKLPSLCTNSAPRTTTISKDKDKQIMVDTPKIGVWQGYRDQNEFRFLGIPYAAPPVGNLRFQGPMHVNYSKFVGSNNTVNDATEFGHVCTQIWGTDGPKLNSSETITFLGAEESEDCLYLNVFTPSLKSNGVKGLSVMVYVHGGSYTSLSGSSPIFEPGNVVSRAGVVVVTLNYRLSIFGLFENAPAIPRSRAPGNLAVRDQIAALQWVHDNIVAFGGDPNQVTIFGESAGAYSMRALISAPSAFGLYHNVISQSDLMGMPFSSPEYSSNIGNLTMHYMGCQSSDLACAQNKTVDEIQAAQEMAIAQVLNNTETSWVPAETVYRPTADGSFIPADFSELVQKGRYNTKAKILWGTTRDEAAAFVPTYFPNPIPVQDANSSLAEILRDNRTRVVLQSPYYKFNDSDPDTVRGEISNALTDYYFGCPLQVMSRGVIAQKSSVYAYKMNHGRNIYLAFGGNVSSLCQNRVCHADDIVPSFGSGDMVPGIEQTGDDARFARQVIDRFTTFAKTGNPNPEQSLAGLARQNEDVTGVKWPVYDVKINTVFGFNLANSTVEKNEDTPRCNWIAENVQYEYQVHSPDGRFVPIYPAINATESYAT